ncbi:MAG: chaperone modulator CbpM [Leadbetterella sp.]|nr:chaperone modulator CbpM [Leadbetterella sp.]
MERISREECVRLYKIDIEFFNALTDAGLIETVKEENTVYLEYKRLGYFEKLVNWHYDLEVNLPGLEVIHHLLERIEALQRERAELLRRL